VHPARDPRLDERARPAREVVEGGRPHPAGHRRQRRRLPPGQAEAYDRRRRLHVRIPDAGAWLLSVRGTGQDLRAAECGGGGARWYRSARGRTLVVVAGRRRPRRTGSSGSRGELDLERWTAGRDGGGAEEDEVEVVALARFVVAGRRPLWTAALGLGDFLSS
jgi:hypothetical protein